MYMKTERSSFTGKIGFVLAAAGSAVGLGNIWRFPYLASEYGGGIFLLVYILISLTFGFALMVAEIAIGRKTGLSAIGAFRALDRRFSFIGILAAVVPVIILPYYSVIGGWVMKYLFGFVIDGADKMATDGYFSDYIGSVGEPIVWFAIFIGLTALIVLLGVDKGIEKVSKFMMPGLIALIVFIVVYNLCTLDGALDGVVYYLKPDFSKFSIMTVVAAMGQLFYSMSLAMGIMITYGSYMKKDINIEKSVHQIEIFDTGVAVLAGLMIVPAVFVFSQTHTDISEAGAGLMFVTLPKIFETLPGGSVIGVIFFVMVFFAALTSSISLMETVVSIIHDKFGIGRKTCCFLALFVCFLLGAPSSLGYSVWGDFTLLGLQLLDFFDFISNSVLMPIVALISCIFIGYFLKTKPLEDEVSLTGSFKMKWLFRVMIRYVAPVFLVLILVSSVLNALGIVMI